jgi:hypothetical protein
MLLVTKELRGGSLGWLGIFWAVFGPSMFGYCSGPLGAGE